MKNILLCVSGGIAAYKAIDLASQMKKAGYQVRTVLTQNAKHFVSPLNFAAITGGSVHEEMFAVTDPIPHINLADWADLIVIAPATANLIAKAVTGIADDLCSNILLAFSKPKLWVPAMNVNMYQHPATQGNLEILKSRGDYILEPMSGMLACNYEGKGKYPPNEEVMAAITCYLEHGRDLEGKKVLVTAGATEEAIDPMRKITNNSSGKMGLALCRALALRGAKVCLVHGRLAVPIPYYLDELIPAYDVDAMLDAVLQKQADADWIIKCAAVSDFKPEQIQDSKIAKRESFELKLVCSPDILEQLGKTKREGQLLIGFAAQTEELIKNATAKLQRKNLDMICANMLSVAGADNTEIFLIKAADPDKHTLLHGSKDSVAHHIIDHIAEL